MNFISSFLFVNAAVIWDSRGRNGPDVTYVTVGTVDAVEGISKDAPTLSVDFNAVTAVAAVAAAGVGVGADADAIGKKIRNVDKYMIEMKENRNENS